MRYDFTVDVNGRTYKCEREVTGKRVMRQIIHVIGVGSKDDSANYGSKHHPPVTMPGIAKIIAHEIIRENI
jgi:hypothetical protein